MTILDDILNGRVGVMDLEEARRVLTGETSTEDARASIQENINTARSVWPKDGTIESKAAHVVFDINQMLLDTANNGVEVNEDVYMEFGKVIKVAGDALLTLHKIGLLRQGAVDAYVAQASHEGHIKTGDEEYILGWVDKRVTSYEQPDWKGHVRAVNHRTGDAFVSWEHGERTMEPISSLRLIEEEDPTIAEKYRSQPDVTDEEVTPGS